MRAKQLLMTRETFEHWAANTKNCRVMVRPPYQLVPCHCNDVNCHGWRFVEQRAAVPAVQPSPDATC